MQRGSELKVRKKLARAIALLKKHLPDVKLSSNVEKVLYVANSATVCGVTFEEVEECFSKFGEIENVYAMANSISFTIVVMKNKADAESALNALQGSHPDNVANKDVIFYLSYLEKVPDSLARCHKTSVNPSGLSLIEDFISEEEEATLCNLIHSLELESGKAPGGLKHRRVHHFGYEFLYGSNSVDLENTAVAAMPDICQSIIDRVMDTGLVVSRPDQCTVNIYESGQGIPSHTDTHSAFEDAIISLSLLSTVSFECRHPGDPQRDTVILPSPRSLLVMTGESRYVWKHGISSRKYDSMPNGRVVKRQKRISFTFRAVRHQPCQCQYPAYCDWKRQEVNEKEGGNECARLPSTSEQASLLESQYVSQVYDAIAPHFDLTRHSRWKAVSAFLHTFPMAATLLDVGCGNGKYLLDDDDKQHTLLKFGCDVSVSQCGVCRAKGVDALAADCLRLPFQECRFDAVLSIAVIHHLSTQSRRVSAVGELLRVLCVGGRALITVWALEQRHGDLASTYLQWGDEKQRQKQPTTAHCSSSADSPATTLPVHVNLTEFPQQDLLVPWHNKQAKGAVGGQQETTFLRYYHVFREGELQQLCETLSDQCEVESCFYEQGNWMAILKKL